MQYNPSVFIQKNNFVFNTTFSIQIGIKRGTAGPGDILDTPDTPHCNTPHCNTPHCNTPFCNTEITCNSQCGCEL